MASTALMGRRAMLGGAAALAGCQQADQPMTIDAVRQASDGIGYMALRSPIVPSARDWFKRVIDRYVAMNVREIHIGLSSPGGSVPAAEDMIAYMDRLHAEKGITFVTHNLGVVASAACYIFLSGQRRLSVPQGTFLFHEAGLRTNGLLTGQLLQEASRQLQEHERKFLALLKTRTRLTEAEAATFIRRTVILSADEARRDGIIDATAPFTVPPGTAVPEIRASTPTVPSAPRAAPTTG